MSDSKKTALVTGASGGIGAEIAKKLAAQGVKVCLSGRNQEKLKALSLEIEDSCIAPCDLTDQTSRAELVNEAEKSLGSTVDILVNNAGVTADTLIMRMSLEQWEKVIDVNLTSCFVLSKAVLRGMLKKRWGRIINITSVIGVSGNPGQGNYAAAKAGITGFSKSLASEIAVRGITVNCVAPGFIETAMTDSIPETFKAEYLKRVPGGRFGSAHEIAAAVGFIASSDSGYMTGQTLHVNGGIYMV